jgi:3-deoxy-7-phosphoheptulonate synthase
MIIVMNKSATQDQIDNVLDRIKDKGLEASVSKGIEKTVIGAIGDERLLDEELLASLPGVEQALHIVKPYKIVAREWHEEDSVINVSGHPIGGKDIQIISGPCSVETPDQMQKAAKAVKAAGVKLMRGGAFYCDQKVTLQTCGSLGGFYLQQNRKIYAVHNLKQHL